MSEKPSNPTLFFQLETSEPGVNGPVVTEITLRDLFAAAVVSGIWGNSAIDMNCDDVAKLGYKQADALLAEREKR